MRRSRPWSRRASTCSGSAGAVIVPVKIPQSVAHSSTIHPLVMKAEGAANHRPWKQTRTGDYSEEVGKRLEAGFFILATDYINALQYRAFALQDVLEKVFSQVDVLHTPVLPIPTPTLEQTAVQQRPRLSEDGHVADAQHAPYQLPRPAGLSVTCGRRLRMACRHRFSWWGGPSREQLLFQLGHRDQQETRASTRRAEGPWPPP